MAAVLKRPWAERKRLKNTASPLASLNRKLGG